MGTGFPSLAEVVRQHRLITFVGYARYQCDCGWTSPEATYCTRSDHTEHIEAMWLGARTILTVEQLDALPNQALIRSASQLVYERNDADNLAGLYGPWVQMGCEVPSFSAEITLPALLIHHPAWERP